MGSVPDNAFTNIKLRLEDHPESIVWTEPRKVSILKGLTGKCGIKVKVFQGQTTPETFSIVTKVKDECQLMHNHVLAEYDRIVSINHKDVTSYIEDCVLCLLQAKEPVVELGVCQIDRKRDRDSSGSEGEMAGKHINKKPSIPPKDIPHELLISPEPLPNSCHAQVMVAENHCSVPIINSPNEVIFPGDGPCTSYDPPRNRWNKPDDTETYIKYPHFVKWSVTKTVTLEKAEKHSFGFKFKVKQCLCRQDDWYTLVIEVREPPALGKLMVGDYIRSVNGQALSNPKEAFDLLVSLDKYTTAKIILQRPEGLIPNIKGKVKDMKGCSGCVKPNTATPNIYEPARPKPVRQESCMSTNSGSSSTLTPIEQKVPLTTYPKTEPGKIVPKSRENSSLVSGLFNIVRPGSSCSVSNESHMNPLQNEKLVDNAEVHLIVQETLSMNNNNSVLSNFHTNQTVKLPKIRIFVCGSEARALAKQLLPSAFLSSENTQNLYECVRCTMDMSKAGDVSFMQWSSYENLIRSEETARMNASNDSLANSDTGKPKDNEYVHRGVVNMEMFIIPDERLFQFGCNYLFTQTSLFLLTFNGAKVLRSAAGEISRLKNMIHCIRSCVGYDCNILTYGLLSSEQADFKDEVQTLFYTSYGQQISKYSVSIPDLILSSPEQQDYVELSESLKRKVWKAVSETIPRQSVSILTVVMMAQLEVLRQEGKQILSDEEFSKLFKAVSPNSEPSLQHVVWTTLREFGEILSTKAAPMNLPNNQEMEKLIFIDPEILLQHIQALICIPQKYSMNSDFTKHCWIKLVATGNISHDDIITIINSANAEKILKLMLAFGMIFKHYTDQDGLEQFFFPYFLSEQGTCHSPIQDPSSACLYLQFVDQTHMSSMQFYQLAFSISSQTDSQRISLNSASVCTIYHQGHEIILVHHKFEDRMQIIVGKSERNRRLCYIYQWLCDVCNVALPPEIQYVLGPECPLNCECKTKSSFNSIHVVDISPGSNVMCKSTRIDHHKTIRRWMSDQGSDSKVYIKDMPFNLFQKLYTYLQCSTTLGQDWRGLGGLLGLSCQDIAVYETQRDPAKHLLLDQNQTNRLTVHELIELLEHPDMDRKDLVELLRDWLDSC